MSYAPDEHFLPSKRAANMVAQPSWKFLLSLVALKHGVMQRDILGPSRLRYIVAARHEAVAVIYQHTQASMPAVGRYFGRDYSTINHALEKLGARSKLVERPTPPPVAPKLPAPAKHLSQPRSPSGKFRKLTALQSAIRRAYQNGVPRDFVVQEYGTTPGSMKVIAHHMGLRRRDFRPKSKHGMAAQ